MSDEDDAKLIEEARDVARLLVKRRPGDAYIVSTLCDRLASRIAYQAKLAERVGLSDADDAKLIARYAGVRHIGNDGYEIGVMAPHLRRLLDLASRGAAMREALEECAAPFHVGDETGLISREEILREFSRRQIVARKALMPLPAPPSPQDKPE